MGVSFAHIPTKRIFERSFQEIMNMSEIIGGSPYGASTLAGGDGSRQPSENGIKIARFQGTHVAEVAKKQTA